MGCADVVVGIYKIELKEYFLSSMFISFTSKLRIYKIELKGTLLGPQP